MKKEDRVGYVNPATIDLDLAYRMSKGWAFSFDEPPEHLTLERDEFPKVMDFDDYAKIKAPKGYRVVVPTCRDIRIETSCFSHVLSSTHTFLDIAFYGCCIEQDNGCMTFSNPVTGKEWRASSPFRYFVRVGVDRLVTEDDLKYGEGEWSGFRVDDMIHRWSSSENAIECAKRIIELRFRNYGEIIVDDNGRDEEWQGK